MQVAAALYGATHVGEWLLRIGAPLPPLAVEIAAAVGNYPLLQRMLALRRGALPPLRRAIAAAAKRMRAAAQLLLESAAAPNPAESFIRGGGAGRCLFPGPLIPSAALGADGALAPSPLSAVADAERRVLFTPDPGVRGAPAATFDYAVTGYPLVLSATAAIVVPRRITPPLAPAAVAAVDGDPTGVTFLTLPVRGFDGPARAVVASFPAGGDLYNVLPDDAAAAGAGGAVRVGPAIPRRQQAVSLLPTAVLNASGPDGALRPLAPGPWRGRLVHGRVVACGACWVNASGAFPECAAAAADGKGGDGWYSECGGDGYEAVMVEYAQVRPHRKVAGARRGNGGLESMKYMGERGCTDRRGESAH